MTALEIAPRNGAAPFTVSRVVVRWRDERAQLSGVLNLMATAVRSRKEARGRLEKLRRRLERWRSEPPAAPARAGWPLPPVAAPGDSGVPAVPAEPGGVWRWLVVGLGMAVVLGVVLGLLKRFMGLEIPTYGMIGFVIGGSYGVAAAWQKRAAEPGPRQ